MNLHSNLFLCQSHYLPRSAWWNLSRSPPPSRSSLQKLSRIQLKRTNHILQDSDRHLNSSHLSMASCGERNFSCCFQDNACQKKHAINLLSYIFFSQFSFLSVSAALIYTHTHTHTLNLFTIRRSLCSRTQPRPGGSCSAPAPCNVCNKNQLDKRTNSCHRNDIKLHVNLTCLNACMYAFMHGLNIDWRVGCVRG